MVIPPLASSNRRKDHSQDLLLQAFVFGDFFFFFNVNFVKDDLKDNTHRKVEQIGVNRFLTKIM